MRKIGLALVVAGFGTAAAADSGIGTDEDARAITAAVTKGDAVPGWYRYGTQKECSHNCYNEWSVPGDVLVMICR